MLQPFAQYVYRKLIQLGARKQGIEEYDKLLAELRECRNKEREIELVVLLESWDAKLADLCKPLAFADKGPEEQEGMFNVAQYQDEWIKRSKGSVRAWYICMASRLCDRHALKIMETPY